MSREIVLVDDDALLRRSLAFHLEQAGYLVHTAGTGEESLALIKNTAPDLVILDIGLPDKDGLEVLREIKMHSDIPVIFLTARRRELDEVVGLEVGADDYITKPFNIDVVLAHVKAVLRRSQETFRQETQTEAIVLSDLEINPAAHTVYCAGNLIDLSPREFDLLLALARKPEKVISTNELLVQVWGSEFIGQPQVVYVHIRWLRQKLEADPNHPKRILTVRRVGYKLVAPEVD